MVAAKIGAEMGGFVHLAYATMHSNILILLFFVFLERLIQILEIVCNYKARKQNINFIYHNSKESFSYVENMCSWPPQAVTAKGPT